MQKVVGLVGLRGSGKDTAAKALVAQGWRRTAFADALYLEVAEAFGVTLEFLGDRDKKEKPQPELALAHCKDQLYVAVLLHEAGLQLGTSDGRTVRAFLRKPRSPREIMQKWGTEYRRMTFRDDYWREQVYQLIKGNPTVNFVVTDVRFPDEAKLVEQALQGQLGRVVRPGLPGSDDKALMHASEVAMLDYPIERVFINAEGQDSLGKFQNSVLSEFH